MIEKPARVIEIFYSYAHEDEVLRARLEKHLSVLSQQHLITGWHDRNIHAGEEWAQKINVHLETADIILLLISPDFMASAYINSVEMKRALERHNAGEARVIPIILVPVYWEDAPFSKLQVLPTDGKPVMSGHWHNDDEALLNVAKGISNVVKALPAKTQEQWLKNGLAYFRAGLYRAALDAAEEAIRLDPTYGHAHKRKGDALYRLKRYNKDALEAYELAIQLDPNSAASHEGRGKALSRFKRHEESLAAYEEAIRLNPNSAEAHSGKARALRLLGRSEQAHLIDEKARQLGSNREEAV